MDRRLKGKVAFVTGAASGIGEATAKRLARGGVAIGIVDLDAAGIDRVVGEIANAGGRAADRNRFARRHLAAAPSLRPGGLVQAGSTEGVDEGP